MNIFSLRRWWYKHRYWAKDIAAGIGFIVFVVAAFKLLDIVADYVQYLQGY
jgi:hypothetical protein